ncbi:uncharacterized protein AKAW2_50299S [Aspergillus luchuensis]|uniref:Uncharacterized protein n=1 Tax=Aspergillus kawachii TaxID=1069201 RepID=A0A7R7WBL0_ASPKA|nr:uncharacterized protein AKAW2_50299S [Aspergillus luchuensis]BCR99957.1 hypothetical protein AKAW2_50299S [Aspergillus luchuensis]
MLECVNGSSCDESDFLTLFSEPTPLVNPTPSVSWIEAELAEMEAKDRYDPQHYESTSGDFSVHDRQMTASSLDDVSCLSQDTHIGRRRPSRTTRTSNSKTPYINFITEASDLAASLREARSARNMLRRKGKQSSAEYEQLTRHIEGLSALLQPSRRRGEKKRRRR